MNHSKKSNSFKITSLQIFGTNPKRSSVIKINNKTFNVIIKSKNNFKSENKNKKKNFIIEVNISKTLRKKVKEDEDIFKDVYELMYYGSKNYIKKDKTKKTFIDEKKKILIEEKNDYLKIDLKENPVKIMKILDIKKLENKKLLEIQRRNGIDNSNLYNSGLTRKTEVSKNFDTANFPINLRKEKNSYRESYLDSFNDFKNKVDYRFNKKSLDQFEKKEKKINLNRILNQVEKKNYYNFEFKNKEIVEKPKINSKYNQNSDLKTKPFEIAEIFEEKKYRKYRKRKRDNKKEKIPFCKCRSKTHCLRLHCSCFKILGFCGPRCQCIDCMNNNKKKFKRTRDLVIKNSLMINPHSFDTSVVIEVEGELINKFGCKCNGECNTNYCKCKKLGTKCSPVCLCSNCMNSKVKLSQEAVRLFYSRRNRKKHKIIINYEDNKVGVKKFKKNANTALSKSIFN